LPSRRYAEASRGISRPLESRSVQFPELAEPVAFEFQNCSASKIKLSRNGETSPMRILEFSAGGSPHIAWHHAGHVPMIRNAPSPRNSNNAKPWVAKNDSKIDVAATYAPNAACASCKNAFSTASPVFALVRKTFQPTPVSLAS
jgi:hypothetical protein